MGGGHLGSATVTASSAFMAWLSATGTLCPNLAREISLLICRMTPPVRHAWLHLNRPGGGGGEGKVPLTFKRHTKTLKD